MRPCTCERVPPKGEPYDVRYCRKCWLFHNSPEYNRAWGGNSSFPSLFQKGKNFVKAVVEHLAGGMKETDPEVKAERMALCVVCPEYDSGKCRECGCDVGWKTGWDEQRCPLGKW